MKKKILFILPSFNFGGTVVSTLNMIMMLGERYDISVFAMTHDGPIKEQYKDIKLLPEDRVLSLSFTSYTKLHGLLNKIRGFCIRVFQRSLQKIGIDADFYLCKAAAERLKRNYQFDIVASCQEDYSTVMASFFTTSKRIAWFRTEYSIFKDMISSQRRNGHHQLYSQFDNIVCVSKTTRDDFVSFFPDLDKKAIAIHNIQKTERIIELSKDAINDLLNDNVFNIVSVGRFAKQKQFSSIPEIAAKVRDTGAKFRWYIIGDGNSAGEYDKTMSNIRKYDVADFVFCIGSRTNPYPYIANADLTVVPSYYEACPRVVIESKILHTPVVCADFSSAREFVTDNVDGYVDKLGELSDLIANLILDKPLYSRINQKCGEFRFDNDVIKKQLYQLFD